MYIPSIQLTSYAVSVFRFDECGISPMTVQALTDAGYVQTTVVQEAALPICLDGTIFILLSLRMFSNKKKENE